MIECLSISLVIYYPDHALLQQTLQSLYHAAIKAQKAGLIEDFFLAVVNNAEHSNPAPSVDLSSWPEQRLSVYSPGNVGYGVGHNLAIRGRCEAFHLVINPDVAVHEDALIECIQYLRNHAQVGMISPLCHRPNGEQEYLCKAYPNVGILFIRGFAPTFIRAYFQKQLAAYETRDNNQQQAVLIASGCFMFFRQHALQEVQGFCEQFFLYFEDFDLSLRLTQNWQIAHVPAVKIIHYGGHSAKKGWRHIVMFARSAQLFFNRHGWQFWS